MFSRVNCNNPTVIYLVNTTAFDSFSTAAVGDPVVYKGIDLAIVDVKTSKITNVYTSADYIREITQKGFPLG